jgi:molybdopterin-binding protein
MTQYRPGEVAELLGVSVDTVRRLADSGRLPTSRAADGRRVVDGEDLARYLQDQAEPGGAGPIVGASARNRFTGIVTRVVRDEVVATVELRSGRHRIVSIMTAEAVDELGLRPGLLAVAAVKATNVVVEVPAR